MSPSDAPPAAVGVASARSINKRRTSGQVGGLSVFGGGGLLQWCLGYGGVEVSRKEACYHLRSILVAGAWWGSVMLSCDGGAETVPVGRSFVIVSHIS